MSPRKKSKKKKPTSKLHLGLWVLNIFVLLLGVGIIFALAGGALIAYYAAQVPDATALKTYTPPQVSRVFAADGSITAEYAEERRIFVPIAQIPKPVIDAFLAAEDSGFFTHGGYDLKAIVRAALVNILTDKTQGASTITQQVAKTFFLSSERTFTRKIKELILAWRLEQTLSKERILELYLNQIFLGNGAYGIVAAAQTYFNKPLAELTIAERALLAGLPKAPSRYNPIRNPAEAKARRDTIIHRMQDEGMITKENADTAILSPLNLNPTRLLATQNAATFSEHVRRFVEAQVGSEKLYRDGLSIHSTLNPTLQAAAVKALYEGLRAYDRRHGWRGGLGKLSVLLDWPIKLAEESEKYNAYGAFGQLAVVLGFEKNSGAATIGLQDGLKGRIPLAGVQWARKYINANAMGDEPTSVRDLLSVGELIWVRPLGEEGELSGKKEPEFGLEQIPAIQGALLALDVRTGAVLAMVGGHGDASGFNRATQALRQPGSAFKPVVYLTALENNYTPASVVLDAPVVLPGGKDGELWKPQNYTEKVYGPTPLRKGLEESRNLMTIRLARDVGMQNVITTARRLGLTGAIDGTDLSVALGTGSVSLMEMTTLYASFANNGIKPIPFWVNTIADASGTIVFDAAMPTVSDSTLVAAHAGVQMVSPTLAYQMTSMLQGVVQRGTATAALSLKRQVAGKTGTTNDYNDAWFIGYSPDIAVGVWVGFDKPENLGRAETGGKAALPIWIEFMQTALRDMPERGFSIPEGITFVRIDAATGLLPNPATTETLVEAFTPGTAPTTSAPTGGVVPEGITGEDGNLSEGLF